MTLSRIVYRLIRKPFRSNFIYLYRIMRGVGFEPTNPYGMRYPSWISSSERHVRIDLTPLTKLGNPRTMNHLFDLHLSNQRIIKNEFNLTFLVF